MGEAPYFGAASRCDAKRWRSEMSRLRTHLANLFRRVHRRDVDSVTADSKEVERLNAE
jgi:hypothetical protein